MPAKDTTKCEVRDQFCNLDATTECRECEQRTCDHCSIVTEPVLGKRTCHACLRKMGVGAIAEMHLRDLGGGAPVRREKPTWMGMRK